ncbi:MAG: hypothetical protein A3K19_03480 [Lentisphaerae bacterium RIFOXYB12_FULL_65_16]|nr:MAG: hypothetical protein A3J79_11090 [Elusimicrobia bacterium RIFOXYB2_FULL_62_6]OGV74408.1 MAG: hypothetical protein A3K18_01260 [Lentisphaerae bacterium RIFOXYA12_64_32]OGV86629.1 MAG: hypothetical protein A3K19_03480 [Lentisphaerae bacterium RIFOXYB12_FULL_65_16]
MCDEAVVIQKILQGDRESFTQLVAKYRAPVIALAFNRIGNAADAQEIAQDAFVAAFQRLPKLRDQNRFGAWLRSITLRLCAMRWRSVKRRPEMQSLPDDHEVPDFASLTSESPFAFEALFRDLPSGLRAAAVLCFEDELSPSAAAAVLRITPTALRKRLYDARARLQRRIVEKTERELQLHLLPKDFAERCICRCGRAVPRKEVTTMAAKKNCGCGCGCSGTRKSKKAKAAQPAPTTKK